MVMKKVKNKAAELVVAATIELLRPYKDFGTNDHYRPRKRVCAP